MENRIIKTIIIVISILISLIIILLLISLIQNQLYSNQPLTKKAQLKCREETISIEIPNNYLVESSEDELDIIDNNYNLIERIIDNSPLKNYDLAEKIINIFSFSMYQKPFSIECKINKFNGMEDLKNVLIENNSYSSILDIAPKPKEITINGYQAMDYQITQNQAKKYKIFAGNIYFLTNKNWFNFSRSYTFNKKMFDSIINTVQIK